MSKTNGRRGYWGLVIVAAALASSPALADLYTFQGTITSIYDPGWLAGGRQVGDAFTYDVHIDFAGDGYRTDGSEAYYYSDSSDTVVPHTDHRDYFQANVTQTLMNGYPGFNHTDYYVGNNYSWTDHVWVNSGYSVPHWSYNPWYGWYISGWEWVDTSYWGYGGSGNSGELLVSDGGLDGYVRIYDAGRWVSAWSVGDVFNATEYGYSFFGTSEIGSTLTLTNIAPDTPLPAAPIPGAALLGVLGLGAAGWRLRRFA